MLSKYNISIPRGIHMCYDNLDGIFQFMCLAFNKQFEDEELNNIDGLKEWADDWASTLNQIKDELGYIIDENCEIKRDGYTLGHYKTIDNGKTEI